MIEQGEISQTLTLTPEDIEIAMSAELNEAATSFKFMNLLAVLLFFSLLLIVVMSSIGHWKNYGEGL